MGSLLGNWPSYDPHNFSQLRPSDRSSPSLQIIDISTYLPTDELEKVQKMTPATYHPTHSRILPPPDQGGRPKPDAHTVDPLLKMKVWLEKGNVITTEAKNILLRHIYQRAEEKLKPKRAASDNLLPEHGYKQPRVSS